ncbi:CDP-alcohol phosphatidyltransferase family protein [Patescibacteria group bacterium]
MFLDAAYQKFKKFSSKWRAINFLPLLKLLARLKITPNKITAFRLLFALPIIYCFYVGNLLGVLIFYLIFWFLDLVDGSLARYLKLQSDKGRFLDSVVDNFMYVFLVLGFIYLGAVKVCLLAYNIIFELFAQLLATIAKKANQPSDWVINVQPDLPYFKSLAHAALLLYFFGYDILLPAFVLINCLLTITAIYYFVKILKSN